ncbi:hypothetical protein GCM10029978_079990 [Actinoallomurus acanthiterrae]
MSGSWQPLSVRLSGEAAGQVLHEGIPSHLRSSLEQWIEWVATEHLAERAALRLRLDLPHGWSWNRLLLQDPSLLLDVVDALLYFHPGHPPTVVEDQAALEIIGERLNQLLVDAGSAYEVANDMSGLTRRLDETVQRAAQYVKQHADADTRDHLRAAWTAAYGLHPDPSKAYGEAVKAVEAASIPVVVPTQAGATLGHVLGQLDRQSHLYELAITDKTRAAASVDAAAHLVRLLWEGHSDRHGGSSLSRPISQEAAEMAVHLATTLVQWFTAGYVRRRP